MPKKNTRENFKILVTFKGKNMQSILDRRRGDGKIEKIEKM